MVVYPVIKMVFLGTVVSTITKALAALSRPSYAFHDQSNIIDFFFLPPVEQTIQSCITFFQGFLKASKRFSPVGGAISVT